MGAIAWGGSVLARVSGGELTVIGIGSVFVSLIGLVLVVHGFNWWDGLRKRREAGGAGRGSAPAGHSVAGDDAATGVGDGDGDPGVYVAISLALALAGQESSAGVPYRVDGAGPGSPISSWRVAARQGGGPR